MALHPTLLRRLAHGELTPFLFLGFSRECCILDVGGTDR